MIQLLRRQLGFYAFLIISVLCIGTVARADITISEPANSATMRGEINVRFSGVPDGGYVIVKVDGNFMQATSQSTFSLNTFDAQSFGISQNAQTDGQHQISITGIDASGKTTSTATVSFTVANNQVDVTAQSVQLTHWVPADRLEEGAQRYRIFAESNATISTPQGSTGGGGGAGMPGGGMPGGAAGGSPDAGIGAGGGAGASSGGSAGWLPSPLDWQYAALLRRVVRDVGLFNGAANIKISIAEAFQRQREGQGGGGSGAGAGLGAGDMPGGGAPGNVNASTGDTASVNTSGAASKAPWAKTWQVAPESGTYFVKAIEPDGEEINATRKKRSIAITDLLPLFPKEKVQPGSRWETLMTFLSDLSARNPFNVKAPITFTGYEDIKLPSGEVRHAAKLESRFTLNQDQNGSVVTKMAAGLAVHGGIAGGGSGASSGAAGGAGADMGMGGAMGAGSSTAGNDDAQIEAMQENIASATIRASRVIWFDIDQHRVLRSQDQINTFFEMKQTVQSQGDAGGGAMGAPPGMGGMPGMPGGETAAAAAPAEPTKVNYTMNVVTWYDDTVPPPTDQYNGGKGTPHSADNVQEPSLSKVTGKF